MRMMHTFNLSVYEICDYNDDASLMFHF